MQQHWRDPRSEFGLRWAVLLAGHAWRSTADEVRSESQECWKQVTMENLVGHEI